MFYISSFLSKKHFAGFNQAYVNAPIEGIKLVDHGLAVQLHIKGKNYIFYPTTNTGESIASKFIEEAHVGDSITKGSESDTLYLLRSPNLPKVIFKHF